MPPGNGSWHLEECDLGEVFSPVQWLFRAYFMPMTYLFGILSNTVNAAVFTQKTMRNVPVNWFFLVLSISDLIMLVSSFFVFSVPVYAESKDDLELTRRSIILIVWFYPIAQTCLTMSVYLTLLVSIHRYLGVCHPFRIRRISNSVAVRVVIVVAVCFAFAFNIPRWFELRAVPCTSAAHKNRPSLLVVPSMMMMNSFYTVVYRNAMYTFVMFFAPFSILSFVNLSIIGTLRKSNRMRRQMTMTCKKRDVTAPMAVEVVKHKEAVASQLVHTTSVDRKDQGVTVMLVAITTEFLVFNLLAFANNMLELLGQEYGQSPIETLLVEVSALLVNLNGASTIVIYLIFGSKYRTVFFKLLNRCGLACDSTHKRTPNYTSVPVNETTQLLDENKIRRHLWKSRKWKSEGGPSRTNGGSMKVSVASPTLG